MADTPDPSSLEKRLTRAIRAVSSDKEDAKPKRKRKSSGLFSIPPGILHAAKIGFLTLPANASSHPFWTRPNRISVARRRIAKDEPDAPVFEPPAIGIDDAIDAVRVDFDQAMEVLKSIMARSVAISAAADTLTANMARNDSLQDVTIDRHVIDRVIRIDATNRLCEWAGVDPNLVHVVRGPDTRRFDMEKAIKRIESALRDVSRRNDQ